VNVRNELNVPQAQSITIRRDSDGKIAGAPILSAAADVGTNRPEKKSAALLG